MKQTSTYVILAILLVTVGVTMLAVHKYEIHATPTKSVDYHSLYTASRKQLKNVTTTNGTLQTENTELITEKTALCGDLSKAKLTDTLCQ